MNHNVKVKTCNVPVGKFVDSDNPKGNPTYIKLNTGEMHIKGEGIDGNCDLSGQNLGRIQGKPYGLPISPL